MDLCNISQIKQLLSDNGFRFSKSMGQNFLIEASVPENIAEGSGIDESCGVLEIGPGIGTLTKQLAMRAGKVVAVELDKRLPSLLAKTLSEFDNVEIVSGDILKTDIPALVSEKLSPLHPHVCANLPYNITSPVISALIESGCFESMTLMIQREVARRLCAEPGTADYGAFTVFVNYYTQPQILFDVTPDCFIPQPKVTSSVIRLDVRKEPPVRPKDEKFFFRVVKAAFAMRRKTLLNSLSSTLGGGFAKDDIAAAIVSCGFDERIRGEELGIPEFSLLSDTLLALLNSDKNNRK